MTLSQIFTISQRLPCGLRAAAASLQNQIGTEERAARSSFGGSSFDVFESNSHTAQCIDKSCTIAAFFAAGCTLILVPMQSESVRSR